MISVDNLIFLYLVSDSRPPLIPGTPYRYRIRTNKAICVQAPIQSPAPPQKRGQSEHAESEAVGLKRDQPEEDHVPGRSELELASCQCRNWPLPVMWTKAPLAAGGPGLAGGGGELPALSGD